MTTLYKAVRPDGTDFHTGAIQWAPPADHEGEWIVRHPDGERKPGTHPSAFLSASTIPTDCVGMSWPCRLLTVEPVEGHPTDRPDREVFPHRVTATAWRVTGERPAHDALGPQGEHVARFIDSLADAPRAAWEAAGDSIRDAAWYAARGAAWEAAQDTVWEAAWDAAWDAAWTAVWGAARDTACDAACDAAWGAVWDAVWGAAAALVARDLVPRETYDILTRPVRLAGITVHPDDPDLTKEN